MFFNGKEIRKKEKLSGIKTHTHKYNFQKPALKDVEERKNIKSTQTIDNKSV